MQNPTQIKGTFPPDQFAITTSFGVGLFQAGTLVGTERNVPKTADMQQPGTNALAVPIPADLFEGVASGTYKVGIRPINDGGPGTWTMSPDQEIIGEPTSVVDVILE